MIVAAILLIFPLCLAFAAISDLLTMTIPNRVSLIIVISFAVLAPLSGVALPAIGMHALGAAIVFGICFALFALNVMGGGDAKLLSAAALWFGCEPALLTFLAYVSAIGGLVTLAILLIRSQSNTILAIGLPIPNSLLLAKKIPYGIAIAIGGFMAFPSSPLFIAALESLK
ncbi:UNVERIFIED_ORG: prepilin peptidase CpaA [Rhizobium sophorae]|uniref:A24 family peptidase n=1 Tax=Rhizobium leguminosarum TaxID=384 RepID=UPI0016093713|nr:prepilin peptidase [Rhizobium leguminosarum]MBB4524271.1 prepilin peptidase CpaA [Rhizobium leguminosarum]MDH6661349.1 prepilin peptidase CpaA [Rhizobium sophorae]